MKIEEIKAIAKQYKIKTSKVTKSDLVRAIQHAEGNIPCFGTNSSMTCGQTGCMWRNDCD